MNWLDFVRMIWAICDWLYFTFCAGAWADGSLAAWSEVHRLTAFAGQYWHDPASGMAAGWAIVVDNLIDLIDPANLRGDH